MRVLAVDFGTSTTVAALSVNGGPVRLVTLDGSSLMPSAVFLNESGLLAVGRDAERQSRLDPSRYEPNPKRRIDETEVLLGSSALPVVDVIAEVLSHVAREVVRQLGAPPDQLRLTHPARWGSARRRVLVTAAQRARLVPEGTDPLLIPEPVAAATHFAAGATGAVDVAEGATLAVYDLGAGTFDVAVLRYVNGGWTVLSEAGLPDLGGLDFEQSMIGHIADTRGAEYPEDWAELMSPSDAATRRLARAFTQDVKDAKESLSRYPQTDVAMPEPFRDVHLTRDEFERLIRPQLDRSVELLANQVERANLEPNQLAGVYLVGGSSRIPLVAKLIQERLGVLPSTLDQPETSVASGALLSTSFTGDTGTYTAPAAVASQTGSQPTSNTGNQPTAGPGGHPAVGTGAQPQVGPGPQPRPGTSNQPMAARPGRPGLPPGRLPMPPPGTRPNQPRPPAIPIRRLPPPAGARPANPRPATGPQPNRPAVATGPHSPAGTAPGWVPGPTGLGRPPAPTGPQPIQSPSTGATPAPPPASSPGMPMLAQSTGAHRAPSTSTGTRPPTPPPGSNGGGGGRHGSPGRSGGIPKRAALIGGGALAVVVVLIVVAITAFSGDSGGDSGSGENPSQAAAQKADENLKKWGDYFPDDQREYLKPVFGEFTNCSKDDPAESENTCTLENKLQLVCADMDSSGYTQDLGVYYKDGIGVDKYDESDWKSPDGERSGVYATYTLWDISDEWKYEKPGVYWEVNGKFACAYGVSQDDNSLDISIDKVEDSWKELFEH